MLRSFIKLTMLFTLVLSLGIPTTFAQNVLDDIEEEDRIAEDSNIAPNLVSETIKVISPSKKIFILTNNNKTFSRGDYISLLLANKLVCRALVAKATDDLLSGIKIVKIYNLTLWKQLGVGKEVLVLKGDDSYYNTKEKNPNEEDAKEKNDLKLQTEEDLFNSTTLNDDDLSLEESSKRLIKTDNLISFGIGMIEGKDVDGSTKKYTHYNGAWGYQFADNIWGELNLGTNTITDYPATGLDTRMINITTKVKYAFDAPFYTYIMPYAGYQIIRADSPSAGIDDGSGRTAEELEAETLAVDELKKSSVIFGATFLKRLVPGWFIRADIGTDILSGGLSLEF